MWLINIEILKTVFADTLTCPFPKVKGNHDIYTIRRRSIWIGTEVMITANRILFVHSDWSNIYFI